MNPDLDEKAYEDPLIDEVRERRRQLLEAHDNDLSKLFETLRRMQEEHPEKIVACKSKQSQAKHSQPES